MNAGHNSIVNTPQTLERMKGQSSDNHTIHCAVSALTERPAIAIALITSSLIYGACPARTLKSPSTRQRTAMHRCRSCARGVHSRVFSRRNSSLCDPLLNPVGIYLRVCYWSFGIDVSVTAQQAGYFCSTRFSRSVCAHRTLPVAIRQHQSRPWLGGCLVRGDAQRETRQG
jgi:hypothetical protein